MSLFFSFSESDGPVRQIGVGELSQLDQRRSPLLSEQLIRGQKKSLCLCVCMFLCVFAYMCECVRTRMHFVFVYEFENTHLSNFVRASTRKKKKRGVKEAENPFNLNEATWSIADSFILTKSSKRHG